ncbi:hypothetical protein HGRIS_007765 [Hohenbuehelia grisea]|uniref:Cytochrome P450 n=1 Tax=Hohenbuehelia grisea TaxID=104357 RepID=A0ABR3J5W0_9AGAR
MYNSCLHWIGRSTAERFSHAVTLRLLYGVIAAVLLLKVVANRFKRQGPLPPGPPGLPIFGNLFQIPKFQWYRFTECKDIYGPIISLNLAGQTVVILNTQEVASDVLDRRSDVYSDRPRFIVAGEILTSLPFLDMEFSGGSCVELRMRV